MSQKEKQSELQVMQLVSSLIAGVLLAFGVSVVVLFVPAHLAAGGKIGTGAVGNAEVIASGLGCFCGSCYLALSYRKRINLGNTVSRSSTDHGLGVNAGSGKNGGC